MVLPLIAAVALVAAIVATRRARGELGGSLPGPRVGCLGVLLAWILLFIALASAHRAFAAFASPVLIDIGIATLAAILALWSFDWSRAEPPGARPRRRTRSAVWIGALLAELAAVHAIVLLRAGELPSLVPPPLLMVQVGRTARLTPRLVRHHGGLSTPLVGQARDVPADDLVANGSWRVETTVVQGERSGTVTAALRTRSARVPWLSARLDVPVKVVEELGDARFPLRVGNRWAYRLTLTGHVDGLVGLFEGESKTRSSAEVTVVGTRELAEGGVRAFQLRTSRTDQDLWVFAADGSLFAAADDGPHPIVAPSADAVSFQPLGDGCRCVDTGPILGLTHCKEAWHAGQGEVLAFGFLTFGLVAPGGGSAEWDLEGARVGPADAPFAPVAPLDGACRRFDADPDPGNDGPPSVRPTPEESSAAAPPWSPANPAMKAPGDEALFEAAAGERPVGDALALACDAHYAGNPHAWFIFSGSLHLDGSFRVADRDPVLVHNGVDGHDLFFLSGPVALHPGDRIGVKLSEEGKALESVSATVAERLPARAERGLASIECRGLDAARVEEVLAPVLSRIDDELMKIAEGVAPRPGEAEFGLASSLKPTRDALREAAVLVGWADPRVLRRVARERAIEDRFASKNRLLVKELAARALPEVVLDGRLAVHAMRFARDAATLAAYARADHESGGALARARCALLVTVRNTGRTAAPLGHIDGAWLAFASGKTRPLVAIASDGSGAALPRSAERLLALVPLGPIDEGDDAYLVVGGEVLAVPLGGPR
jgi:hypothetical protein